MEQKYYWTILSVWESEADKLELHPPPDTETTMALIL